MIALILAAALQAQTCVPSLSGGYLPTPSPCRVTITDPITRQPEVLTVRLLGEPKKLKPGKYPLGDFERNPRSKWRWLLVALVIV